MGYSFDDIINNPSEGKILIYPSSPSRYVFRQRYYAYLLPSPPAQDFAEITFSLFLHFSRFLPTYARRLLMTLNLSCIYLALTLNPRLLGVAVAGDLTDDELTIFSAKVFLFLPFYAVISDVANFWFSFHTDIPRSFTSTNRSQEAACSSCTTDSVGATESLSDGLLPSQ